MRIAKHLINDKKILAFLKLHENCQALQLIYHKPLTVICCFSKVAEIFFSHFCYFYSLLLLIFHMYFNIHALLVCLFVSNKHHKTAETIQPKFLWDLTRPQERFIMIKIKKLACNKV